MTRRPHVPDINSKDPPFTIEMLRIKDLHPFPGNPRKWSQLQLDQLKAGIKSNGFLVPIVVNQEGMILSGHMRVDAAKELGYTEVPGIRLAMQDKEKEREILLRLNKNGGDWDWGELEKFEIELLLEIGFGDEDLGKIWDAALETEDDGFDLEKEVADIPEPKAKTGDLYEIAGHRIICGDATDPAVIKRLVGDAKISMLYSDPPYNISLDYSAGISAKMRYGGKTKDNKSDEEYRAFLSAALTNGLSVCESDCHVFTYCDQKYIGMLQSLYPELGIENKRVALWIKNNFNMTPQVAFNKCYEPVIYGTRGSPYLSPRAQNFTEILNKDISNGNRAIEDILDMLDIWLCKRLPSSDYEHPTAKNPLLHERPLRRCTRVCDTVLDLFGGSGSTLIAAHQLKRKAFLVEWEPLFVDVILRRFEKAFGIAPTLLNP